MENFRKIRMIFWVTLGLNIAVAIAKFILAASSQSLSLFSDGLHSLMDSFSNIIALVSLKIASRPPDQDHPYGHRRFETLGAMAISGLLCLAAWEILESAWHRILSPVQLPKVDAVVIIGVAFMLVVNVFISFYERHWGKKLKSPLLLADAEHTFSDALASILALVAIITAKFKWYWVDTLSAVLIVGLILNAAYRIVKNSVLTLSDANRLNPMPIKKLVEKISEVKNCHNVRSHGPDGQIHVDLHIVVSPSLTAQQTFEIENEVTQSIKKVYPEVSEVTVRHQTNMPNNP
jgi:cation diffusion facilitator family transporter